MDCVSARTFGNAMLQAGSMHYGGSSGALLGLNDSRKMLARADALLNWANAIPAKVTRLQTVEFGRSVRRGHDVTPLWVIYRL